MKSDKTRDLMERYNRLNNSKKDWVAEYTQSLMQEDGRAHLRVDLRNAEIFSPYSENNKISPDLFEYIDDQVQFLSSDENLSIDFIVDEGSDDIKETLSKQIKQQYLFKFDEAKRNKMDALRKSLHFLLVGVLFCIVYIIVSVFANLESVSSNAKLWLQITGEVIDIIYWVFIWEATDKFFFERREVQRRLLRLTQLCTADINFLNGDKVK